MVYRRDPIGLPWTEGNTWQSVDTPDEWIPVIVRLNEDLLKLDPNYRVAQVKEKFGGLRYYFQSSAKATVIDLMDVRVREAEQEVDKAG